jgi:hypothetical protein
MGTCQLCGNERKLIDAHLIPRCMYELEGELPIKVIGIYGKSRPKRAPIGIYDKDILCAECDGRIGIWDQHACEVLNSVKRNLTVTRVSDGFAVDEEGTPLCYTIERADPELMSKFVLSVIWRGHISKRPEAKVVKLGSHAARIKEIILKDIPIKAHNYKVQLEFNPDFAIEMFVGRNKMLDRTINTFHAQNFGFHMNTDKQVLLEQFLPLYLKKNHPVLAISFNKKDTPFGRSVIQGLRENYALYGDPWKNMRVKHG